MSSLRQLCLTRCQPPHDGVVVITDALTHERIDQVPLSQVYDLFGHREKLYYSGRVGLGTVTLYEELPREKFE